MSEGAKQYRLGNVKTLIDLNQDSTNFEIDFQVVCQEQQEFLALVVDQDVLDSTPNLQYQTAKGSIGGRLSKTDNEFKPHYLVLKSEQPIEVQVTVNKTDLQ